MLEPNIYNAIQRIKLYKDAQDIRFVNTQIGKYRLEAEKYWGLIRRNIHYQATYIEKMLRYSIDDYYEYKANKYN